MKPYTKHATTLRLGGSNQSSYCNRANLATQTADYIRAFSAAIYEFPTLRKIDGGLSHDRAKSYRSFFPFVP